MKLTQDLKIDIQTFVYFLFKGTFDARLIVKAEYDYLELLLNDPKLLYNCFVVFAYSNQIETQDLKNLVVDYIIALHKNQKVAQDIIIEATLYCDSKDNFWNEFLKLSRCFCFNIFPEKVGCNYLGGLSGCGADALPPFALWTNVIEVNKNLISLNAEHAFQRANDKMKALWDNVSPRVPFLPHELEQELY